MDTTVLIARLDESYTVFGTGEFVHRVREVVFQVTSADECNHRDGSICTGCAPSWQLDYEFDEPFPFERVRRVTVAELIGAGRVKVGDRVASPEFDVTAVITACGGLMLPDGRIFTNPSAAAHAARAASAE
ncbi:MULTISPECIES: hypothetical protein [Nocardia]|uniref:Uncharacterized protein n=2 Tax=Nocardia TaxID=1817 RepID=A0A846XFK9_9NOCA|nr:MULTISPECIES: hypothetical protein [Nocardia]MBF6456053.1 hypothetical protein [Nocardia cyriacigeorgica]MBF6553207.1 hypothetical protein [Nocardia cyriacigeorgica]NKY34878.1 hypothetical protein [Nocardia speluncae]TLF77705.1 hypothetical protein FEK34_15510 [Nocardia cyriacigeorgica]